MISGEEILERLARLADGHFQRLKADPASALHELDAGTMEEIERRRYERRLYSSFCAPGEFIGIGWARYRVIDLVGRGMTPAAVIERLSGPAEVRGVSIEELRAVVAQVASEAA